MHGLQIVPLGELLGELPHSAALVPAFERDALIEDLLEDDEDDADRTADLSGVSPVTGVHATVAPAPAAAEEWLSATAAAEALDISVRHLRRLATAGKVERRRDEERTMYRIAPWLEEQRRAPAERQADADTGAAPSPDTCRAAEPRREPAAATATPASEGAEAEVTGVVARAQVARRREVSVHESETVIAVDDIDLFADDVDEPADKVVAQELVNTNRELMRLVEGLLGRWSEVNNEQNRAQGEIKHAMQVTLQVQQCLQHWQHHASHLERVVLEKVHLATRALDVADEALSTRWTTAKRQRTLRERLTGLRDQLGER